MKIDTHLYERLPIELKELFILTHEAGCPGKLLDQMSGVSKSNDTPRNRLTLGSFGMPNDTTPEYSDKGGASRFFKQCNFMEEELCQDQNLNQLNANIVEKSLYLYEKVECFVQNLVVIKENQEDKLLSNMITPFMNEIQKVLNKNSEQNIKQMKIIGQKLLLELKHIIMEKLKDSHVKFVEIQKLINTMMIIQNLLNIDGFVEVVMSNTILKNMVLGERDLRIKYCAKASKSERNVGLEWFEEKEVAVNVHQNTTCSICGKFIRVDYGLKGCQCKNPIPGKVNKTFSKNIHPTVKPIKLMEYLVKLVTPKNGIVLDPFMGSGTTAIACIKNNFKFIGFEKETEYKEIADARIGKELQQKKLGDV
jgi:tRNA G10  N-methylase Trm11